MKTKTIFSIAAATVALLILNGCGYPAYPQTMPGGGGGGTLTAGSNVSFDTGATCPGGTCTISSTGGSAAAGGSSTQVQRNNAGALAGVTGVTSNGTSMTFASAAFLLSGSTSGTVTLNAPATGGGTLTLPPGTDTIAGLAATQAFTNKTYNGNTWTAGTGVLTIAAAKTLTASNTLTFAGTDGSTLNVGTGGTLGTNAFLSTVFAPVASPTFTGTVTIPNGGVFGVPTSVTLTNATGLVPSTGLAATGTPSGSTCLLGNNTWGSCASGGSGTVTSIAAGSGISLSTDPCTATCTISTTVNRNAQTGTSYATLSGDGGKIVTLNNASAVAVSLSQANTAGFTSGFGVEYAALGAGQVTVTATTSVFGNGLTTLLLDKGQYALVVSDSTNYPVTGVTLPVVPADGVMGNYTGTSNFPKWAVIPACANDGVHALVFVSHAWACSSLTTGGAGTVTSVAQSFTGGLISVAGSPVTLSGTLALTVAGTSGGVPYFSSSSTWASSAALASNALVIGGGAGAAPATTTTGSGVLTALGNAVSAAGGVTTTVASGTSALGTSAISSGACATAVTTTATNTATTDVIMAGFNGDPTAVTGYAPATAGMLTIISYPSANNVNFKVCNNTSSSITPGAITLNWRVVR